MKLISNNKHLLWLALFTFLIIYLSSFVKGYGYFIDEPYDIACALNPDFTSDNNHRGLNIAPASRLSAARLQFQKRITLFSS